MSEGVRLHHPEYRSLTYVVEDPRRPYQAPLQCAPCSASLMRPIEHAVKTYHFHLDAQGDVIVSPQIAARIRSLPLQAGLEVANAVAEPPPQVLSLNGHLEIGKIKRFESGGS